MGDKSDPALIKEMFPGMSKKQFKDAVGGLYRDGMIIPSRDSIELIPGTVRHGHGQPCHASCLPSTSNQLQI